MDTPQNIQTTVIHFGLKSMAKAEEAESKPIKQEPVELPQSLSEVYHGPTRNFRKFRRYINWKWL